MKKVLILILIIAMNNGCANTSDNPSLLRIRLSNISLYNFENIIVDTSTGIVNFENLDSGKNTEYKQFTKAYSYAFIELEIDGNTYTIQPIDYVEEPLKNGDYTYQINIDNLQGQYGSLNLTLIED